MRQRRRALLVGVDDYQDPGGLDLEACVSDAEAMASLLERHEDREKNYDCELFDSSAYQAGFVTRGDLLVKLDEWFSDARGADLLFYFSGHGAVTRFGPQLVTSDLQPPHDLGIGVQALVHRANLSDAREVLIILDCCFSGSAGQWSGPLDEFAKVPLREEMTIMASSRPQQVSTATSEHSSYTQLLLTGLQGAAADIRGRVTPPELHAFACAGFREGWGQEPVLRTNTSSPHVLRRCAPALPTEHLEALSIHFTEPDLRRDWPTTEGPTDALTAHLEVLRSAGLLDARAALSGEVRLNARGQYLWRLSREGLF